MSYKTTQEETNRIPILAAFISGIGSSSSISTLYSRQACNFKPSQTYQDMVIPYLSIIGRVLHVFTGTRGVHGGTLRRRMEISGQARLSPSFPHGKLHKLARRFCSGRAFLFGWTSVSANVRQRVHAESGQRKSRINQP